MPVVEALDLAGRLVVAGAFGWAAVGKLADLPQLRATLYLSRLTRPWVPQLAVLLPATELALACGLLGARAAGWVAPASAALLAGFVAYLALDPSAAQGCACFGGRTATSRRVGIARDVLLLAALLPALARGPSAGRWGVPPAAEVPAAAAAAVAGAALLVRAFTRRTPAGPGRDGGPATGRRRAGVPPAPPPAVHRAAPAFDVRALDGTRLALADLAGRPGGVLLVFAEPGCALCEALLPHLSARADAVVLAAVEPAASPRGPGGERGDPAAVAEWAVAHGLEPSRTVADAGGAVADAYRVPGVPAACRVDASGLLVDASGVPVPRLAVGPEAVRALVAGARPVTRPLAPPGR